LASFSMKANEGDKERESSLCVCAYTCVRIYARDSIQILIFSVSLTFYPL